MAKKSIGHPKVNSGLQAAAARAVANTKKIVKSSYNGGTDVDNDANEAPKGKRKLSV